jgi:hypothetical protein
MRYAHIFCGWSKRLKPNESRRAFIRGAWLCFAASTSRSHAPRALLDEAIAFGRRQRDPSRRHWLVPADIRVDLGQSVAKSMLLRDGSMCMLTSASGQTAKYSLRANVFRHPQ